jgi:hypothetical protein
VTELGVIGATAGVTPKMTVESSARAIVHEMPTNLQRDLRVPLPPRSLMLDVGSAARERQMLQHRRKFFPSSPLGPFS